MMKRKCLWIGCLAAFAIGCSVGCSKEAEPEGGVAANTKDSGAPTTGSFAAVQEIFTKNCVGCHGGEKPKCDINLTSYEGVMKGGEDGPIVTAGDPDKSK